jgi:hypothetical protein
MLSDVLKILTFQPYRIRSEDPFMHFTKKVKGRPFTLAILGHQQIKYAKARFRKGTLELMKTSTAFVDNFQNAEQDSAWVVDFIQEAGEAKQLLLGINCMFSNLKIYSKDSRLREIEKALEANPEEEVGKSYEKQTKYFLTQAGDQFSLNGVEREKIAKPIEKFRRWGFEVAAVFHYPTSVIARISSMPLNWTAPGILVYYTQRLIFFMGWTDHEVVTLRSKLFAEATRNPTGQKPLMNSIQREIDTTLNIITNKAPGATVNIYTFHDKLDPTFSGLEAVYKDSRQITWPQDTFESDVKPYTDPDMAIIREIEEQKVESK